MLIVFDLDDTLIDTSGGVTPYKMRCVANWLKERGFCGEGGYEELRVLNDQSKSFFEAIREFLGRYSAMEVLTEVASLCTSPLPEGFSIPTTPGAKAVVDHLKKKYVPMAVVTSGIASFQLEKMEKAGLERSNFSKIVVPGDAGKGPCYEGLLVDFFLENPQAACVVGDRVWGDLAPAYALGMRTVHMRWGRGLKEAEEEWVDHSISSLSELLKLL